jgi:hypothetical protein
LALIGVSHELTIPYHPAANGLVERQNAEILKHLKGIIHARGVKESWSTYLPMVARTINNAWHSAIDNAPTRLVLGNINSLHRSLQLVPEINDDEMTPDRASEFARSFLKVQNIILSKAAQRQEVLLNKLTEKYTKKAPCTLEIGSFALWKAPSKKDKLSLHWMGPYKLVRKEAQLNSYVIADVITGKEKTVHVNQLKPFKFLAPSQIEEAAKLGNESMSKVEAVIDHQMDEPTNRMMFLVRWSGWGPEDDTWEFLETVEQLSAFEIYLREHPELKEILNLPNEE